MEKYSIYIFFLGVLVLNNPLVIPELSKSEFCSSTSQIIQEFVPELLQRSPLGVNGPCI